MTAAPITLKAKLGWASGDFGFNIFWQALNLLLLPFYTDVLGLDPRLAGSVFLIASLWDGFADTVIGAIADRTRTRWGSYRPYLIFASPVVVVAFMLCFLTPDIPQLGLFLYALLSQLFLRTSYSVVSIPYSSLSARISSDADERASMAGWRMFFAFSGGAAVTFLMPLLIQSLGRDDPASYVVAAGLVGLVSLPFFWLCFATTSEPPHIADANPRGFSWRACGEDLLSVAAIARGNDALMRIFGCIIVSSLAFTMTNKCLVYYITYYLERPDLVGSIVPFALAINLLFAPVWALVAQATSKRAAWLIANLVSAFAYTLFFLTPSRDPLVAAALIGLISIDYAPNQQQTEATLLGLKAIMAIVPLIGVAISAWLVWGYPLDQAYHRRLAAESE